LPPVRTPRPGLGRIACSPAWAGVERATGCRGRAVGRAFSRATIHAGATRV
jgi:hypothetical protein